jgi:hypothetical protein
MNHSDKSDYRKGLLYFCCLITCISLWLTTPDGDTLFYKFLGLFGLSPGIRLRDNSTLYIYMLIPLIAAIFSLNKVFKYWHGYGSRFREYSSLLRTLPVFIIAIPVLLGSNIMHPSGMDHIYNAAISQRSGLQAVTCYAANEQLSYEFTGNNWTYSYDLAFDNHGNEAVEFNVKLLCNIWDDIQEAIIKDDNGQTKTFILPPKQMAYFTGEFTAYHQTTTGSGSGNGTLSGNDMWGFSVVILNDNEQHSPKRLVRRPLL